jgi:hypothetical protein
MNSFRVVNTVSRRMMSSGVHQPFAIKPKFKVPKSAGMAVSVQSVCIHILCFVCIPSFDRCSDNIPLHSISLRMIRCSYIIQSITHFTTNKGYGNKIVGHQPRSSRRTRRSRSVRCRNGCSRSYEGNDYQHWCEEC